MSLENFDDLFVGNPVDIERNLKDLLPQASALEDTSIYLQILSQIALAQAMQKKFEVAHQTLDGAEKQLKPENHLARVRILLEKGRVFMQSGHLEQARPYFFQSYELSSEHQFDYHTANAAHMIAIVAKTPDEKIHWNSLAIDLAENSSIKRAKAWLGALYNNLGQAYIEAKQYETALEAFNKSLEIREEEGYAANIRVAKWAIARTLRFLHLHEEALSLLLPLLQEYHSMEAHNELDIPQEILPSVRGLVFEELAEVYQAKAKEFAKLAYRDLSQDEWFRKLEKNRLERLKALSTEI